MSFQTIIIAGHLGRDPEMRYTPAGQAVTNFNLAANRQYTDSSGQVVKETTWFRVSAWGNLLNSPHRGKHEEEDLPRQAGRCSQSHPAIRQVAALTTRGATQPDRIWLRLRRLRPGRPGAEFAV